MHYVVMTLLLFSGSVFAQYTNESELAYVQSGGNSDVKTTNTKTINNMKWEKNQFRFGGRYLYGESDDSVTARNWDAHGKYERELSRHLSATIGEVIEGNSLIGIKARYNSDIGLKYYYIRSDDKNLFTELSYRYAIEDRYQPEGNTFDNRARFFNELQHKISKTVQYRLWIEYIPNFTEKGDHLLNFEASLTSILNSVFSLKVAYTGMYDSKPVNSGLQNYDYNTTTSLVVKF